MRKENLLINTLRGIAKDSIKEIPDLVYGEVVSVSPLQVRVDNRFIVDENFVILSALCKEKVGVWRGLLVGDNLRMIKLGSGQVFYAIERDGDL